MKRAVAERAKHVRTIVQSGALAPHQHLDQGAEHGGSGGNKREQQRGSTLARLEPVCGTKKQPERQEAHGAQHPTQVVIVDIELHDMLPRPAIAEVRHDDRGDRHNDDSDGKAHQSNIFVPMRLFALLSLLVAASASAQDIPPYVPANPLLASRSALYAQPFISPHAGWQSRVITDYYNAVEVSQSGSLPSLRETIFDAEVLQADFWVTRDVSRRVFIVANLPMRGGYDGFLDGFLNWYHKVFHLSVPARDELPIDKFEWSFVLPDSTVNRTKPGTFVGDARAGVGVRLGNSAQFVATVTLPTATLSDDGWTRHVIGTSLALTDQLVHTGRVVLDASASAGYTPTHGALAKYQRSLFASGMVSGRWRFAGSQSLFSTVWVQSGNWKDTGFASVDDPEVSLDFGFLLHVKKGWPELQLGMTQDLAPHGPAMDVGFVVGVRW